MPFLIQFKYAFSTARCRLCEPVRVTVVVGKIVGVVGIGFVTIGVADPGGTFANAFCAFSVSFGLPGLLET
jgi:hypothetical protein|tara:strand:- start:50502 stop:50714 length:213 start_codon:yes stop_codon:yes gene_type:complete